MSRFKNKAERTAYFSRRLEPVIDDPERIKAREVTILANLANAHRLTEGEERTVVAALITTEGEKGHRKHGRLGKAHDGHSP